MGYLCVLFLATLVVLGVLIYVVGSFLPDRHTIARSQIVPQPPENVWALIANDAQAPSWRPTVQSSERQPDSDGHEVWQETYQTGRKLNLETVEALPPQRLVRAVSDPRGFFSGRWVYEIAQMQQGGTRLTITEHGEIPSPFVRCAYRALMDPKTNLDEYLRAVAAKFGAPVNITS